MDAFFGFMAIADAVSVGCTDILRYFMLDELGSVAEAGSTLNKWSLCLRELTRLPLRE